MDEEFSLSKVIFILYFMIFAFAFLSGLGIEPDPIDNPFDYARITDLDYRAELIDEPNSLGKVKVTETITFDIHAAFKNNLFWELWRDLPEDDVDGLKIHYNVLSVKEIKDDGKVVIYEKSPKLYWYDSDYTNSPYGPGKWFHSKGPYDEDIGNYEALMLYIDGIYRDKVTFEIEYELYNAALKYKDISELYLTLYSEDSIKYLKSLDAQILIKNKDMPNKGNYSVHTLGTINEKFEVKESDTLNPGYHTFYFNLDEDDLKFKPYNQYIDFILWGYNEDSQKFTTYAIDNLYSDDLAKQELINDYTSELVYISFMKKAKVGGFIITIGMSFMTILLLSTCDKFYKKKYCIYNKPNIVFYRDIPSDLDPYFVSKFINIKDNSNNDDTNGYSAVLLNLVRKGYLELIETGNPNMAGSSNITIVLKYRPQIITNNNISNVSELNTVSVNQLGVSTQNTTINNIIDMPKTINQITPNVVQKVNTDGKILEELTLGEEHYFNLLVRHCGSYGRILMSDFKKLVLNDEDNTDKFVTNMNKVLVDLGVSNGYFQKKDYNEARNRIRTTSKWLFVSGLIILFSNLLVDNTRLDYMYGGLLILGLIFMIGASYLKKLSNKYVLLTELGEEEYAKWRGLYNFLNSATLMNERTHIELPLWEKYLVYATAFGISEKVVKALEIRCPDLANSALLSNRYYSSNSFRTYNRSFHHSVRSASYSSRSGSSYYGGGGRGGGGGGGGH